ncbi:MAG: polysaccharide deacetylase family protein, partial [Alphaproteobacteria bacterium]|nr:polysaccharide deacetylase family protein [Alphaproteobacteria bacterium]
TTTPPDPGARRWDCSGMDPADPAPLHGRVALTFDDGPDPVDTATILQLLHDEGIPATFFTLGEQVSDPAAWGLVEQMVDDPLFEVANHSWDHADLATLSLSAVEDEMDDPDALLRTFGITPRFFRFPYGDATCATHDLATDRGWRVTGWHIDTADWCYASGGGVCTNDDYWRVPTEYEDDFLGLTMEQIHRFDGGILLLHDIHRFTADMLPELIGILRDEGYVFTSLDDVSTFPNLVAGTPEDLPYLGERCDVLDDRCWMVEHEAWCEPTTATGTNGICTLPCENSCLDRDGAATTFCADLGGAGQCVGRVDDENDACAALPGTVATDMDRFGWPAGTVRVCAPQTW